MRGSDDVTLTQGATLALFMRSYTNEYHNFIMKEKICAAFFFFALLVRPHPSVNL